MLRALVSSVVVRYKKLIVYDLMENSHARKDSSTIYFLRSFVLVIMNEFGIAHSESNYHRGPQSTTTVST